MLRPKALNYRCHIQYFYPGEFIMKNYQITQWCSRFIEEQVKEGDICIDATMGNGNDTLLLSRLAGPDGQVLAFDIQEQALQAARQKLLRENAPANYTLFL